MHCWREEEKRREEGFFLFCFFKKKTFFHVVNQADEGGLEKGKRVSYLIPE